MDDNFLTFWVFRDRRLKLKMLCVHVYSKLLQFRILAIINDCDNISSSLAMLDIQSVPKLNDTAKLQKKVIRASNSFQKWILKKTEIFSLFFREFTFGTNY
jgi:hypothetical protein